MRYLALPPVSSELEAAALAVAEGLALSDNRPGFSRLYADSTNIVMYEFAQAPDLTQTINTEFGGFFGEHLHPVVGVMRNTGVGAAEIPPHFDRFRKLAVNYVLRSGGKATTDFYDFERGDGEDISQGLHLSYDGLAFVDGSIIPEKRWHVVNVQQAHAVHNIESTRVTLGFVLGSNPDFISFTDTHKDLLCH